MSVDNTPWHQTELVSVEELEQLARIAIKYFEAKLPFAIDGSISSRIKLIGYVPIKAFRILLMANFSRVACQHEGARYVCEISYPLQLFLSQNQKDFLEFVIYTNNPHLLCYILEAGRLSEINYLIENMNDNIAQVIAAGIGADLRNKILHRCITLDKTLIFVYMRHNYLESLTDFITTLCNDFDEDVVQKHANWFRRTIGYIMMPTVPILIKNYTKLLSFIIEVATHKSDINLVNLFRKTLVSSVKTAMEISINEPDKIKNIMSCLDRCIIANKQRDVIIDLFCAIPDLYSHAKTMCENWAQVMHDGKYTILYAKKLKLAEVFHTALLNSDLQTAKFHYAQWSEFDAFMNGCLTTTIFIDLCRKRKPLVIKYYCTVYFHYRRFLPFVRALDTQRSRDDITMIDTIFYYAFNYYDSALISVPKDLKDYLRSDISCFRSTYKKIHDNYYAKNVEMFNNYDKLYSDLKTNSKDL